MHYMPTAMLHDSPILPDIDNLRSAIKAADERARLLRRLLRAALRLQLHLTPADKLAAPRHTANAQGGAA
jgi:hypothetical protein